MDFIQKKKINSNQEKYHLENLKIAREFSKSILKETNELTRSIVIFGSNNSKTLNKNSDIDIMIVLDNVSIFVSEELKESYKIITNKLIKKSGDKIHLFSVNLSDLWDMARKGDPILINILRFGLPLFDRDLIEPLQYLLEIGKIRPTKEAIYNYISRSTTLLEETNKKILDAVFDLYYSLTDMIHATLMINKIMPPSPKEMPKIFKKQFKNNKEFSKISLEIDKMYKLIKNIEYGKINKIKGSEFDNLKLKIEKIITKLKKYNFEKIKEIDNFDL